VSFQRRKLTLKPLALRAHDLDLSAIRPLEPSGLRYDTLVEVAGRIKAARAAGAEVIMMMGGHVIRSGVQRYIIDMMEKGHVTCLAMNGACVIHDFELALVGATTESVSRYVASGEFGLWEETGRINDIVNEAYRKGGLGMGEAVGRAIHDGDYPHKGISLLAACHRLGVPATVHIGVGYDINHEHPNFDGAAAGATSYMDFLRFTDVVSRLEGGVNMCFGSAVMAPEVFLKALSMARNVAHGEGRAIRRFATLVCDLRDLPASINKEAPKHEEGYYFRPWKTLLVRTVSDGGEGFYVKGEHSDTVPALWSALQQEGGGGSAA
jgi:hypothetical protein